MNENTEYEIYTKEIYNHILNEESVTNILVEHNVLKEGKSGTKHQIDVFWEFQQFNEKIKVAIECKRYSKNVSVGVVRDFKSVLDDLNCSKGIIATTTGFQKGAITFAKHNAISLKVIRPPKEIELQGIPKYLNLNINITPRKVKSVSISLDKDWCLSNVENMNENFSTSFNKLNADVILINGNGKKIADLLSLENDLPVDKSPSKDNVHTYKFEDAFIVFDNNKLLKVSEVVYKYDIHLITRNETIDVHSQLKAIIKDCITNEDKLI